MAKLFLKRGIMNKKISVIVPVYKVEKYLARCVDSIINQTYKNLEIILVDDGSPDGCGKICDEYAERDSRIKVIHKENGGLSSARNAGLDIATGDYIGFVDSDDFIDLDMYSLLYEMIKNGDVEITGVNGQSFVEEEHLKPWVVGREKLIKEMSGEDAVKGLLLRTFISSVCSKLFSAKLFENKRFATGKLSEDALLLFEIFVYEKCRYRYVDDHYYFYFMRDDSICRSPERLSIYPAFLNALYMEEIVKKEKLPLENEANDAVLFAARTYCLLTSRKKYKQNIDASKNVYAQVKARRKSISQTIMSKRDKCVMSLYSFFPRFTIFVLNAIKSVRKR